MPLLGAACASLHPQPPSCRLPAYRVGTSLRLADLCGRRRRYCKMRKELSRRGLADLNRFPSFLPSPPLSHRALDLSALPARRVPAGFISSSCTPTGQDRLAAGRFDGRSAAKWHPSALQSVNRIVLS